MIHPSGASTNQIIVNVDEREQQEHTRSPRCRFSDKLCLVKRSTRPGTSRTNLVNTSFSFLSLWEDINAKKNQMKEWVQLVGQIFFRFLVLVITQANNGVLEQGLNVAHRVHGSTKVSSVVDKGVARVPTSVKVR